MIYSVKELTEGKIKGRLEKQIKCYTPTLYSKGIKIMKNKSYNDNHKEKCDFPTLKKRRRMYDFTININFLIY